MGVRTLTCLFRVHSSVPAGPVSNPSCTRPRLVWYWTFPSGSPPVFSTTSPYPPPRLSPVILISPSTAFSLCHPDVHMLPSSSSPPTPSPHLPVSLHLFLQTFHKASCVFRVVFTSRFFLCSFLLGFCPHFPENPPSGPQQPHCACCSLPWWSSVFPQLLFFLTLFVLAVLGLLCCVSVL